MEKKKKGAGFSITFTWTLNPSSIKASFCQKELRMWNEAKTCHSPATMSQGQDRKVRIRSLVLNMLTMYKQSSSWIISIINKGSLWKTPQPRVSIPRVVFRVHRAFSTALLTKEGLLTALEWSVFPCRIMSLQPHYKVTGNKHQ